MTLLQEKIDHIIPLLCKIESNNDPNAIGDNGLAVGILQIQPIMIEDVNRILSLKRIKKQYKLADRKDVIKSIEIANIFFRNYCNDNSTLEELSRRWNGGPKGDKKEATKPYWNKINALLSQKESTI